MINENDIRCYIDGLANDIKWHFDYSKDMTCRCSKVTKFTLVISITVLWCHVSLTLISQETGGWPKCHKLQFPMARTRGPPWNELSTILLSCDIVGLFFSYSSVLMREHHFFLLRFRGGLSGSVEIWKCWNQLEK